jgi:hypothetical protein
VHAFARADAGPSRRIAMLRLLGVVLTIYGTMHLYALGNA